MTITVPTMPAVSLVGNPVTVRVLAAAACTAIPDSMPVMLDVAVSVAVIDWVPDVSSVIEKLCLPASDGEGKVRAAARRARRYW